MGLQFDKDWKQGRTIGLECIRYNFSITGFLEVGMPFPTISMFLYLSYYIPVHICWFFVLYILSGRIGYDTRMADPTS